MVLSVATTPGWSIWPTIIEPGFFSPLHTCFEMGSHRYRISFMHNYKTERYHDGGTMEISKDGGVSWETVGNVRTDWFNTQFVTSLDVIKPGWTSNSNGYRPASIVVEIPKTGPVIFRFRFGSDQGIETEGWAIDDFCFQQTFDAADFYVGMEESIPGVCPWRIVPQPGREGSYKYQLRTQRCGYSGAQPFEGIC